MTMPARTYDVPRMTPARHEGEHGAHYYEAGRFLTPEERRTVKETGTMPRVDTTTEETGR